jgi:hypothetical protein
VLIVCTAPVSIVCILSLPLILAGIVRPDPHPWNWRTLYITDVVFGLTLVVQMIGFMRRAAWNRIWTACAGGYAVLSFGQMCLELLLDMAGLQPAPVTNGGFLLGVMFYGLCVGMLLAACAFLYPALWKQEKVPAKPGTGMAAARTDREYTYVQEEE